MKLSAIFALCVLLLSSFALAQAAKDADTFKSDEIGVAIDLLVKNTSETILEGVPELVEGYPDHKLQPEEGYTAKVLSVKGEELYSFKFPVEFWFYDNPTILKEKPVLIIFPYYRNVREAKIYDKNDSLVLSVDLSGYTTCNENAVCNANIGENEELCPSDCRPGEAEKIEAEQPEEPAEEAPEAEPAKAKLSSAWLIALLAVVLAAIVIGLLRTRKKE